MNPLSLAIALVALLLWAWAVARLLLDKREPTSTIAWLLFVTAFAVAGPLFFLILGPQRLERRAVRRRQRLAARATPGESDARERAVNAPPLSHLETRLIRLATQVSEFAVTGGNRVEILPNPAEGLHAMREAIKDAKHFIHLEYYIIATDEVTRDLFNDLTEAARRGVEVRILYDAFGSLSLKRLALRKLEKAGVKVAGFAPFSLFPRHINPHFRNHRKILVVDGRVAFTGGANIGKEYLGRSTRKQWRDYLIRVRGPVCVQLQEVFGKDWLFTTGEDLLVDRYHPEPEIAGNTVVQVIESGPDTRFQALHQILFLALNSAEQEILLTTPYFIPDPALSASLMVAALRGVKVQLLLPAKSDAPLVQWASRSFYDDLLAAGVTIHHYQPTILHAKMLSIDGKWSMFGSANMDIRSFRLNFELNLLMFGETLGSQAATLFRNDQLNSKPVDREKFQRRSIGERLLENACRLLSPVL
jgi:cardiolipin synthase A/B